jgi:hypothetical protein
LIFDLFHETPGTAAHDRSRRLSGWLSFQAGLISGNGPDAIETEREHLTANESR